MRDIILIFLLCVVLVVLVNPGHQTKDFYSYDSSYPSLFLSPSTKGGSSKKKSIQRLFKWQDYQKVQREVLFEIPGAILKKEIRKFGLTRTMTHPFFLKTRGFKIIGDTGNPYARKGKDHGVRIIDYKQIFQRNLGYFGKITQTLIKSAGVPQGKDPLLPFLSFVQNIPYKLPPPRYKGRFINSFFIPLVVLGEQYGDCDSKSLLLAEFLCTTPQALASTSKGEKVAMVLVRGNGLAHAILAIKRRSLPGMSSMFDMKKGNYILVEATRPSWAPGFISRRVADAIRAGFFRFVELN
jgi:hypothetical protein